MNKKFLAMLLALAMIISMVPMVVGAAGCTHNGESHWIPTATSGQHAKVCGICWSHIFETGSCNYQNGQCTVCGGYAPETEEPETPECDHVRAIKPNDDGVTHSVYCRICNEPMGNENCTFVNGSCICGNSNKNTEPECKHKTAIKANDDGVTHTSYCRLCNGNTVIQKCNFDANGVCTICGNGSKNAESECKHEIAYRANEDGVTHTSYCRICNGNTVIHYCTFNANGVCIYCGNGAKEEEKLPEANNCKHPETSRSYERNATGGHDFYCSECKQYVHENCNFVDGKCVCGATNSDYVKPTTPACEHPEADYFYKPIDDTHHKIICLNCGKAVVTSKECEFVDGKCACGNTKVVEPTDPEKPTEPENPTEPEKPTEPEEPTNPECKHDKQTTGKKVEATCGQDGYQEQVCEDCGEVIHKHIIPATGNHNWEVEYKCDATETEDGWIRYTCSGCNQSYTDIIPATGADSEVPEDTTPVNPNLDDVPRTGSSFLEWLYALIFG